MSDRAADTVFNGSIAAAYDRFMVPLLFQPFADEMARRSTVLRPHDVLEIAAGTGVVTAALHRALPGAAIVATDLNPPMLEMARQRVGSADVRFQEANAQELPFANASFDLVVCQFGVMFFPDKVRANAEARRVLRDGGHYMMAIWDRVDRNPATQAAGAAVARLFPGDGDAFYERIPFQYHQVEMIEGDLRAAGFSQIALETVELRSRAASARDVATGLVQGTPMRSEIEARGADMLAKATDAATEALRAFEGSNGFDAPMSAHIVIAAR